LIDQHTDLYASFAEQAGSTGCKFFNPAFQRNGINAIYKSFSVTNIQAALSAMKILRIKGAGITMPYKKEALMHVDTMSEHVMEIGATNTIINKDGYLHAENTDWLSVRDLLQEKGITSIVILGNGGYADAVKYACHKLGVTILANITRQNWSDIEHLRDVTVFNCTPVEGVETHQSVDFIDCLVWTPTGKHLAHEQGKYQFKLYTGKEYS
jgi:shikimate dehydrogenase